MSESQDGEQVEAGIDYEKKFGRLQNQLEEAEDSLEGGWPEKSRRELTVLVGMAEGLIQQLEEDDARI